MYRWECLDSSEENNILAKLKSIEEGQNFKTELWQSSPWLNYLIKQNIGLKLFILFKNEVLCAYAIVTYASPISGFSYSYLQRGPVFRSSDEESKLLDIIYKNSGDYILVDPSTYNMKIKNNLKIKFVDKGIVPSNTIQIDLDLSLDEILKQMKKKGRYNLKKSLNNGLNIKTTNDSNSDLLDTFYSLMKKTSYRQKIPLLEYSDFKAKIECLNSIIFVVYKNEIPISSSLMIIKDEIAYYYYGAMDSDFKQYMASYFIQWKMIQFAKKLGCKRYDFLGISPESASKNHYLRSVSNFKRKFGGFLIKTNPPYIYINNSIKYKILMILKKIKAILLK